MGGAGGGVLPRGGQWDRCRRRRAPSTEIFAARGGGGRSGVAARRAGRGRTRTRARPGVTPSAPAAASFGGKGEPGGPGLSALDPPSKRRRLRRPLLLARGKRGASAGVGRTGGAGKFRRRPEGREGRPYPPLESPATRRTRRSTFPLTLLLRSRTATRPPPSLGLETGDRRDPNSLRRRALRRSPRPQSARSLAGAAAERSLRRALVSPDEVG